MRNIGRIILIAVGATMIALGVTGIFANIGAIKDLISEFKASGIQELLSGEKRTETIQLVITVVLQGIFTLAGISAVIAGLLDHSGFWFTVFAIIILALLTVEVYYKIKDGAFTTSDKKVLNVFIMLKDFALLIGYCVGFLMIKFCPKHEGKKAVKHEKAAKSAKK